MRLGVVRQRRGRSVSPMARRPAVRQGSYDDDDFSATGGSARMNTRTAVVLLAMLFLSADRLPAPISEESPTPNPRPVSTPRPKPKIATTPKPKATPISFSGNWTGLINSHCGDVDYSGQLNLTVSSDERSV